jgi:NADH dehydrogenase FAD-containing subunit
VASHFKGRKNVTLVHSGDILIGKPFKPKLGQGLHNQLKDLGVKVILGERIDGIQGRTTGSLGGMRSFETRTHGTIKGTHGTLKLTLGRISLTRREHAADYLFIATGNKPRGGELLSTLAPYAITESGHIAVTSKLNLAKHPNIYVIGDANDAPVLKMAVTGGQQAQVAAKVSGSCLVRVRFHLLTERREQNVIAPSAHVEFKPSQELIIVTVGPKGGQAQMFGFGVGVSVLLGSVCVFVDVRQNG